MTCCAALLVLSASSAAFSDSCRTGLDVKIAAQTKGGAIAMCPAMTLNGWAAYRNGGQPWRANTGPWGPARAFGFLSIGIGETIRTQAEFIIFEHETDDGVVSTSCMPVTAACP